MRSSTRSSCTACSATSGRPRCRCATSSTAPSTGRGSSRKRRPRLPEEFTAVRFYFRDSFPDTPENRELVHDVVERLAERRPVVLLNTGVVVDEHLDAEPPASERILRPLAGIEAARNLAAQSAVVARAKLFVGTYGGLAHLAPFYGVPTLGFASDPREINPVHLTVARRTAVVYDTPLAVVTPATYELLEAA